MQKNPLSRKDYTTNCEVHTAILDLERQKTFSCWEAGKELEKDETTNYKVHSAVVCSSTHTHTLHLLLWLRSVRRS